MTRGDARARSAAAHASPPVTEADDIRNVVLVGPSGGGKTTLVEHLLAATGAVNRPGSVAEGTTVSDFDGSETARGRSAQLAVVSVRYAGKAVNLIDTPGSPDFVGELRAGLRAADSALFVVSAVDGVDDATRLLWEECAAAGMPRAIVVTKLDLPGADFDESVAVCRRFLGGDRSADASATGIIPLAVPLAGDDGTAGGLLHLLSRQVWDSTSGSRIAAEPAPEHLAGIAEDRDVLLESIVAESDDDTLVDRHLAGDALDAAALTTGLATAVARGSLIPVLPMAVSRGIGIPELLDILVQCAPSPCERETPPVTTAGGAPSGPVPCSVDGPLLAEVIQTTTDPGVGPVHVVRVWSGTLRPGMPVHSRGHFRGGSDVRNFDVDEHVGTVGQQAGTARVSTPVVGAGDIAGVTGLTQARTGDTLSEGTAPLLLEPWLLPEPWLPVAVQPGFPPADLSAAITRLLAEDPVVQVEAGTDSFSPVLHCMGQAHAERTLHRLRVLSGLPLKLAPAPLPLRETFSAPARGTGRHVELSGGQEQHVVCTLEVEPLPPGSGVEFADRTEGGTLPRTGRVLIEKGVRTQLQRGVAAGYPVVDVRVSLLGGTADPRSSDSGFREAGARAVQDAADTAGARLLEPVDELGVTVADEYAEAVLDDLAGRRGRIVGTEVQSSGRTQVRAEVPQLELSRYAVDLRSISHGTGAFTRRYRCHQPLPSHVKKKLLAAPSA